MPKVKNAPCQMCRAPHPYHAADCAAVRAKLVAEINASKQHNGWTNYETWVVNLWIDNEQALHEERRERVADILRDNLTDVSVCCEADTSDEYEETETAVHHALVCDNCGKACTTQKGLDTDAAVAAVAEWLQGWITDEIPDLYFEDTVAKVQRGALGPYCDLLGAALSEVDWREIAQHDVAEERAEVIADATADAEASAESEA